MRALRSVQPTSLKTSPNVRISSEQLYAIDLVQRAFVGSRFLVLDRRLVSMNRNIGRQTCQPAKSGRLEWGGLGKCQPSLIKKISLRSYFANVKLCNRAKISNANNFSTDASFTGICLYTHEED